MQSPDIRYVTSSDATRIAYWEMGDGPGRPIVLIPSQFSSVEFSASDDESLAWHRHMAANRRLVKYDLRGFGLSGMPREADGYSILRQIDDFRALLDRLELSDVDIWGSYCGVRVALEIAAIEPQVAHVVASGGQSMMLIPYVPPQRNQAIAALRSVGDLDLWRDGLARYFCGDGPEAQSTAREFAFCLNSLESWERLEEMWKSVSQFDPARVATPTLVIHAGRSNIPADSEERAQNSAKSLARDLENASFHLMPNAVSNVFRIPAPEIWGVVEPFLDADRRLAERPTRPSAFRTILFTDVVSSTPLLTQLRDARMREVMRDHDAVMEAAVTGHGGRVVKTIGDAFMAEFAVPSAAVEAAIEAQRTIREKFADADVPVRIRIGINAGEPIEEDGDLHGASVVIAKRLESAADSNGILVSDVVKQMVTGKDFDFEDRGQIELKGFEELVRAWAVRWE